MQKQEVAITIIDDNTGLSKKKLRAFVRDAVKMHKNGMLSAESAIIASGTFGDTTTHSPILIKKGGSLIDIRAKKHRIHATIDCLDTAVIKATHLTKVFGQATIHS